MVEWILLLQLESEMDEVPRGFAISNIQSSHVVDERSVYASCVRSSMICGSETRLLLD